MSDVALYPIRGQVAQVNGKSEFIVYVPRADKYTYGTVKIGDGLLINSETGAVDFDSSEIKTKSIALNGVTLKPDDNKHLNISVGKADVGLSQVDNTSDASKPVSILQEQRIQEIKNGLMDDIMSVQSDLSDYKLVVEGLFADAEESLDGKLLVINNTISSNKNNVDAELLKINNILKGKEQSLAYANYQEVVNAFNAAATNAYNVGQTIYVQSTKVPDLWVYSVENTHVDFAYVGDEEIIDTLSENGFVQFGYYKLAMMETKSTDVANAVTLDTAQTITGNKTFQGDVTCNYQLSYEKTNAQIQRGNITFKVQNQQTNKGATLYINNMTATLGGFDRNGNVRGVQYRTSDDTTNLIGTVKLNDKNIATTDMLQSVDADTIGNLIQDSGSIAHTVINNKLKFELDADITSQISKSLVTPMTRPTATQLVAVDNTNSQTMINLGDGLVLDGETLKVTGGGSGGSSINVIDNLTSKSSTDALSAKQGNELYTQIRETKSKITETELASQKHILVKGDGVLDGNVYRFTINNPTKYNKYKTHLTRFLVDLHLPVVEALDSAKEVVITFGDTTYYVHNILKGMEHATIGDLKQVGKYDASGYRFTTEMTFFQISGAVGFAIIPTISMSEVLSLDSGQMDKYVVDGGLLQGQLAICRKVITNGYEEGALYRFDILYPNTYSWTHLSYSKSGVDNIVQSAITDVINNLDNTYAKDSDISNLQSQIDNLSTGGGGGGSSYTMVGATLSEIYSAVTNTTMTPKLDKIFCVPNATNIPTSVNMNMAMLNQTVHIVENDIPCHLASDAMLFLKFDGLCGKMDSSGNTTETYAMFSGSTNILMAGMQELNVNIIGKLSSDGVLSLECRGLMIGTIASTAPEMYVLNGNIPLNNTSVYGYFYFA